MPPAVIALSLSVFAIGTGEFVTSGLLPDLSAAGWLLLVVGALATMEFVGPREPRGIRLLSGAMGFGLPQDPPSLVEQDNPADESPSAPRSVAALSALGATRAEWRRQQGSNPDSSSINRRTKPKDARCYF